MKETENFHRSLFQRFLPEMKGRRCNRPYEGGHNLKVCEYDRVGTSLCIDDTIIQWMGICILQNTETKEKFYRLRASAYTIDYDIDSFDSLGDFEKHVFNLYKMFNDLNNNC